MELSENISRGLLERISTEQASDTTSILRRRLLREETGPKSSQTFRSKPEDNRKRDEGYPTHVFLLIPLILFGLYELAHYYHYKLPEQLKIVDEVEHPDRFIGERAERYLKGLTDIGARIVGSYENEVLAVNYLTKEIKTIINGANEFHSYSLDIQKPTGSYYLDYKPFGIRNVYANIQNVVVKVSPNHKQTNHSLLLNCHYDTYEESPGATDDGINCAIMLELLRKISHFQEHLQSNLVFLFNGAEENPLQASHGFITKHKWSKETRALVNLEGCGGGMREFMFQFSAEYPWLIQAYADSVPYPSASVTVEEMFRANLVPSDTDFRIFRDYGGLPGFDFAQCDNGYIYHTRYDKMEFIPSGVYQHTGDNMLALIKKLTSSPQLEFMETSKTNNNKIVYYDLYGLFLVKYSESAALWWNLSWAVLSFVSIYVSYRRFSGMSNIKESLTLSTFVQVASWSLTFTIFVIIPKLLDSINSTMSWYRQPYLVILIYYVPLFYAGAALPVFFQWRNKGRKTNVQQVEENMFGVQVLWSCLLICGTLLGIRSSYLTMFLVVFPTLGNFFLVVFRNEFQGRKSLYVRLVALLPALMVVSYLTARLMSLFVPVTGRMGPHKNPEVLTSILSFYLGTHLISYLTPLLLLFKSPRKIIFGLLSAHILTISAVSMTSFGFPYVGDENAPAFQRFHLIHTERTFFDQVGEVRRQDSGFWGLGLDRNNIQYIRDVIPEVSTAVKMDSDCRMELYCGAPIFKSRMVSYMDHSFWIPTRNPPFIHNPTVLEVLNQTHYDSKLRRIHFKLTGTDHMSAFISPFHGVQLKKWSFENEEPQEEIKWNGRPTYFIYYSHGLVGGSVEFTIDLEVSGEVKGPILDISVVGHYLHDRKYWSEEFKGLLSKFPQWAHVTPWNAMFKSWII